MRAPVTVASAAVKPLQRAQAFEKIPERRVIRAVGEVATIASGSLIRCCQIARIARQKSPETVKRETLGNYERS